MVPDPINVLFKKIAKDDKDAFNQLFESYYSRLIRFAGQYITEIEAAEEIVSMVFINLWQKRNLLNTVISANSYLYKAVKNACLNDLRTVGRKRITGNSSEALRSEDHYLLESKELTKILDAAVNALPEKRRIIFQLIKEQGLKCREVAEILEISERTVENQLYKAVGKLALIVEAYLGYAPKRVDYKTKRGIHLFFNF